MSSSQRSRPRILLADDDVIFRSLCVTKLKTLDAEIIEAGDGVEAWHLIKSGGCSLALLDTDMPNMNGVALTQCIRSHSLTRQTPIVMITSREDVSTLRQTLQAGATSYLTKPVNWSLFMDHISHLLSLGHAVCGSDGDVSQQAHLHNAGRALNQLYHDEFTRPLPSEGERARRGALLARLHGAIAASEGGEHQAIQVGRLIEEAMAGKGSAAIEIESYSGPGRIRGVEPALRALISEMVTIAVSMSRDEAPARVVLESAGDGMRVGAYVGAAAAARGDDIMFLVQALGVLAALNGGEVFAEEVAGGRGLGFGVRIEDLSHEYDAVGGAHDFATAV